MKKTLIALVALSGVAMADTITEDIMALPTTSITQITTQPTGWNQNIGTQKNISAAIVANDLKVCSTLAADGWHWGLANLQNAQNSDCTISEGNFSFRGRQAYGGEFVASTLDVADLLTANNANALTGLTFNFARHSGSQADLTFSVWHWDGTSTEATALIAAADQLSTSATDYTWTASAAGYTSGKLLVVFSESSGGNLNTIEGFKATATMTAVPEPATATLSLLALAGLASRRRRH